MLTDLYIRDLAVVKQLELSLDHGLNVFTGETGAGKSIMIDALSLVLGTRADTDVIRHGCDSAEVLASFHVHADQDAAQWLEENDLFEDGQCVLRRLIYREKPTKGFINGRPVAMQSLRDLGDLLVDIHGQHEHQSLLKRDVQRQILDDYAEQTDNVRRVSALYHDYRALLQRRDKLSADLQDRDERLELLRYQVDELKDLTLGRDEYAALQDEHARLANASELIEGIQATIAALYEDENGNANQLLVSANERLHILTKFDGALDENIKLLNEALIQVDETVNSLRHYLDRLQLDPDRLGSVDQQLGTIHDLARKHRVQPEQLSAVRERLAQQLSELEDTDYHLAAIEEELAGVQAEYQTVAETLSRARRKAAKRLSSEVTDHMQELGMAGGEFAVAVTGNRTDAPNAHGFDRIEFIVTANPGQPLKPLTKVASGGELSRVSLALQVVAASIGRIPTLIFDEVDVGIGGRVAEIVGRLLSSLGASRQVLCITHLAQVAAQGSHHYCVQKRSRPEISVAIDALDGETRVAELARMIGGISITEQTLAHAEDMLMRASA